MEAWHVSEMEQAALPGMESGRRTERVEWGLRHTRDSFMFKRGEVSMRPSLENALECLASDYCGWDGTEQLVSRTIVTYTGRWGAVTVPGQGGGAGA
jgi:hypothetical protein